MSVKPVVYVGLALNSQLNTLAEIFIRKLIKFVENFLKYKIVLIAPTNIILPKFPCKIIYYMDDSSLFDFSRYNRILLSKSLAADDILIAFNDTLGAGRKLNLGLRFYIYISLYILSFDTKNRFNFFAPVDKDDYSLWICPYFFVGKIKFIRKLNFINWLPSRSYLPKPIRYKLIEWIYYSWRGSKNSSNKQKKIKYKTLLLERTLINTNEINRMNFMFSRRNLLRIVNSLLN